MSTLSEQIPLSDFDYDLPLELIAQAPVPVRDRSRLLVLDRATGAVQHRVFADILSFLTEGDVLVLNDTRVFSCRLNVRKAGGGKAELFLLEEQGINLWRAMVRGGMEPGSRIEVADGITAVVAAVDDDGVRIVRFLGVPDIRRALPDIGHVPLPPYIKRTPGLEDRERYQTVYAAQEGAVAAPTAGLHFTEVLLRDIRKRGIEVVTVTLHVGPGTFQPVRTERVAGHRMHAERYEVPQMSADRINRAKAEGRRVIAVGTTTVRTIETAADQDRLVRPGAGTTDLFILPGHEFKVVDGMITNFHLPKSTLLMLVAAFAGRERVLEAYRLAVAAGYRFYSYGDAMLIL